MAVSHFLRDLLIGKEWIPSRGEYKESLLRAQFGVLIGTICLLYIVFDSINGMWAFIPFYILGITMAVVIVVMNRYRKSTAASIVILSFSNILVYLFAAIDSPLSGLFLYFTATAAAALILFARSNKHIGFIFASISLTLGLIAYTTDWSIVPVVEQSEAYIQATFLINYIVGMLACMLIIHFAITRNNESEQSLRQNISRREEVEQALLDKNDELLKANAELDRFVYSASHDMRAPLSSLLGLLEIVRLTNKDSQLSEYFELMKKRILTMEGFIKEITDYSRNSRTDVILEKINLYDLVIDVIGTIEHSSQDVEISKRINIPRDFVITCDVPRMKVILANILGNCIKYCDKGKPDRYYEVTTNRDDFGLTINIEDNGIGIEEVYKDKIFNMFFRATDRSNGSGLGLYIVKETVEKLGGKISFQSVYGEGSTFTLHLPKISQDDISELVMSESPIKLASENKA